MRAWVSYFSVFFSCYLFLRSNTWYSGQNFPHLANCCVCFLFANALTLIGTFTPALGFFYSYIVLPKIVYLFVCGFQSLRALSCAESSIYLAIFNSFGDAFACACLRYIYMCVWCVLGWKP